jgi:hypothetical protein
MAFRPLLLCLAAASLLTAAVLLQGEPAAVPIPAAFEPSSETIPPQRIPEPATLAILLGAGAILGVLARKRTIFSRD